VFPRSTETPRSPVADNSFDIAISEYGASSWCDRRCGFPKPPAFSGRRALIFLRNSTLLNCARLLTLMLRAPACSDLRRRRADRPARWRHPLPLPTGPISSYSRIRIPDRGTHRVVVRRRSLRLRVRLIRMGI